MATRNPSSKATAKADAENKAPEQTEDKAPEQTEDKAPGQVETASEATPEQRIEWKAEQEADETRWLAMRMLEALLAQPDFDRKYYGNRFDVDHMKEGQPAMAVLAQRCFDQARIVREALAAAASECREEIIAEGMLALAQVTKTETE